MITLLDYTIFSSILFVISLLGLMNNRESLIGMLMCLEIMLLAVCTNFVAAAQYWGAVSGQIMVFVVLAVAAAESAIGLALIVHMYRQHHNIDVDHLAHLKG